MKIDWAIPCRYAEIHDGLSTIIGAGADTLTVPSVPLPVAMPFVISICTAPADAGDHELTAAVLGPTLEQIVELKAEFTAPADAHALPGWEGHSPVVATVQFLASEVGVYTATFRVDEHPAISVPLIVQTA